MNKVQFGKVFVLDQTATNHTKTIRTLQQRDAYMATLDTEDSTLAKGNYDWWSLPGGRLMVVTGEHIQKFRQYQKDHEVPLVKADEQYYQALSQRAQDFVDLHTKKADESHPNPVKVTIPEQNAEPKVITAEKKPNLVGRIKNKLQQFLGWVLRRS
jgi:hypothetical protein